MMNIIMTTGLTSRAPAGSETTNRTWWLTNNLVISTWSSKLFVFKVKKMKWKFCKRFRHVVCGFFVCKLHQNFPSASGPSIRSSLDRIHSVISLRLFEIGKVITVVRWESSCLFKNVTKLPFKKYMLNFGPF